MTFDLARYGVTGEALPNDAATTWPSGVRSTPSRETRKVEFLNARSSTTAVYWVDFDGKETHYVDLPPGMSTLMSTFATHSWVARDMASARAIVHREPRADTKTRTRVSDQERPRRSSPWTPPSAEEIDASETLVGAGADPAPGAGGPEKPEKQTEPGRNHGHAIGRAAGEESRNANPADAVRKASIAARGTVMYFSFADREEDARHSYHAGRVIAERAR